MKKLLIGLFLVLLLAAGATVYYLDTVVQQGIEVVGSDLLDTEVGVASVSISPLDGAGTLRGLSIKNPAEFNSEYAFQLDEVSITLDPASLLTDVVEVTQVTIVQPKINYEARLTTDNIRSLLGNLPDDDSGASSEAEGSGKRLIIREFRLLQPQVTLLAANLSAPVQLPDIELRNLGDGSVQATTADILRTVLGSLNRAIIQANIPNMDQLRSQVEGRLQDGVNQLQNQLQDGADGVENLLQDSVDDAVDDLGSRLRRILN